MGGWVGVGGLGGAVGWWRCLWAGKSVARLSIREKEGYLVLLGVGGRGGDLRGGGAGDWGVGVGWSREIDQSSVMRDEGIRAVNTKNSS